MTDLDRTFVFAQQSSDSGGVIVPLIGLAIFAAVIAGVWKVFTKAGQPGWGALIPIYNVVLLLQIAKRPVWWLLLLFVPLVNLVVTVVVSVDIAKRFGKGVGFGMGLAFLGFVFYPVLGFSDARYQTV
jgi:hypothetical protein